MFCEKKNLSVRRKIFKVWKGKKNVSVEFRVFGKKNERKVPRKKIKVFWVEILLSSCSLVNLRVKVMRENDENFQSVFRVGVLCLTHVGRHVVNEPKVGCYVVNERGVS